MRFRTSFAIGVGLCLLIGACATVKAPPAPSTISLEKVVHFSAADGSDALAPPGTYRVDQMEETKLRLAPVGEGEQKPPLVIQALVTKHEEPLAASLALSIPYKEDEHHIVLLLPEGKVLDAVGSYSGVRARDIAPVASPMVGQYAAQYPVYLLGPDLRIKAVDGYPNPAPAFEKINGQMVARKYLLNVTIENIGNRYAKFPSFALNDTPLIIGGPSYFKDSSDNQSYFSTLLQPGETRTYKIGAMTNCPAAGAIPRLQLAVDPYNKVDERGQTTTEIILPGETRLKTSVALQGGEIVPLGARPVRVMLDPSNAINESNETNNIDGAILTVGY